MTEKKKRIDRLITLEEAIELTFRYRWDSLKSVNNYIFYVKDLYDFFGRDCKLSMLSTPLINKFTEYLSKEKKNSPSSINLKLTVLKTVYETTFEYTEGAIKAPSALTFKRQKVYRKRERFLELSEEEMIYNFLKKEGSPDHFMMRNIIIILIDTGIRIGEFFNLKKKDYRDSERFLRIYETKTNQPRVVPLSPRADTAIKELLQHKGYEWSKLSPMKPYKFRLLWKEIKGSMFPDDQDFVPHMLRHTCASRLLQKGAPIQAIQQLLGHSSLSSTMRYAHLGHNSMLQELIQNQ